MSVNTSRSEHPVDAGARLRLWRCWPGKRHSSRPRSHPFQSAGGTLSPLRHTVTDPCTGRHWGGTSPGRWTQGTVVFAVSLSHFAAGVQRRRTPAPVVGQAPFQSPSPPGSPRPISSTLDREIGEPGDGDEPAVSPPGFVVALDRISNTACSQPSRPSEPKEMTGRFAPGPPARLEILSLSYTFFLP